ncbi:MAG TPA: FAD-dependent monooxygenase [Hyphomicrobiales bacterium]|nr:FAD-dependent monooxygenase [Hyphomicrobiales bacterium]
MAASDNEAPVLIAGGGMVGLSAAAFLADQGIRSIAVERMKTSSPLPRAAFFHMRTLEMFRAIGIEQAVRKQSEREFVPEGGIVAMNAVAGKVLAEIIPELNDGVDAVSPCRRLFINQPSLEPILRARAREAGAIVIQGAEVTDVRQDADGVSLTIKDVDGGNARELHGLPLDAYRVGADLGDPEGSFLAAYGIPADGAALIRPDGFVQWRSAGASPDAGRVMTDVLRLALGH